MNRSINHWRNNLQSIIDKHRKRNIGTDISFHDTLRSQLLSSASSQGHPLTKPQPILNPKLE